MRENDRVAKATETIEAPIGRVWNALVDPAAIAKWMFGAKVESDWKPGSKITWRGEFNGKPFVDEGEILRFEPEQVLSFRHQGKHVVTISLSGGPARTTVILTQD